MKLCSQAFQGTNPAARAVGISGIHAGEDVKTVIVAPDCCNTRPAAEAALVLKR
jgi:hypothetical protein